MIHGLDKPDRTLPVALLLVSVAALAGCSARQQQDRPEVEPPALVVLISLDTLRPDRLGCYGAKRNTSQNLDKLATKGVRFMTVAAQSSGTHVSHKSMLAGKYPLRIARETNNATLERLASINDAKSYIMATFRAPRVEPLVAVLRSHGYNTAAFTDGGWLSRQMGFAVGFNTFHDRGGGLNGILPRVNAWLSRNMTGRRFVFVHSFDTHCPYWCREPYNSMFCTDHSRHDALQGRCDKAGLMSMSRTEDGLRAILDHYDGGVASADAHLGELFRKLRELNLYDEALIVVTSDHGESLGRPGRIGHGGLYPEQLLVPLIIKFPASWKPVPAVLPKPVELVDVMPTILDACGLELPEGLDGRSLLPIIRSGGRGRRHLIAQMTFEEGPELISNPCKRALLDPGRWLLIHDGRTAAAQLFDLVADPTALTDVADEKPRQLANLAAILAAYEASEPTGEFIEPPPVNISDELRRGLEALGYVAN